MNLPFDLFGISILNGKEWKVHLEFVDIESCHKGENWAMHAVKSNRDRTLHWIFRKKTVVLKLPINLQSRQGYKRKVCS